jgi:hypothetical protein
MLLKAIIERRLLRSAACVLGLFGPTITWFLFASTAG